MPHVASETLPICNIGLFVGLKELNKRVKELSKAAVYSVLDCTGSRHSEKLIRNWKVVFADGGVVLRITLLTKALQNYSISTKRAEALIRGVLPELRSVPGDDKAEEKPDNTVDDIVSSGHESPVVPSEPEPVDISTDDSTSAHSATPPNSPRDAVVESRSNNVTEVQAVYNPPQEDLVGDGSDDNSEDEEDDEGVHDEFETMSDQPVVQKRPGIPTRYTVGSVATLAYGALMYKLFG